MRGRLDKMKTFRTFGVVLLVVASVGVATTAAASAETPKAQFLEGKTSTTFTGTSGKWHLSTKGVPVSIECTTGKESGEVKSSGVGTLAVTLEGCTLLGAKALSLGVSVSGKIVFSASFSLAYGSLIPLFAVFVAVIVEAHIEVPAVGQLLLLKGSLILAFGNLTSGTEVTATHLIATVKEGKPGATKYWTESGGTESHPLLLTSVNGGAFEESGFEWAENNVSYASMLGISF
jgi:hypothetical protein